MQHVSNCDNCDNDEDDDGDDDDDVHDSTTINSSLAVAEGNTPSDCMVCSLTFLSNLMFVGPCIIVITEEQKPTRCLLLFYCTSYRLNMFRALLFQIHSTI